MHTLHCALLHILDGLVLAEIAWTPALPSIALVALGIVGLVRMTPSLNYLQLWLGSF